VIKADGLAAGKGVVVTEDRDAAIGAVEERLVRGAFGEAGSRIVIEEFLDGQEASQMVLTDGSTNAMCEPAQDYKRVNDDDAGPNTGGMGSYSPVPACPPDVAEQIAAEVIKPAIATTAEMGAPFVGALYAGLALTSKGPKVVEFNVRFGDPETQALLPRLDSDLGEIAKACARGELAGVAVEWRKQASVAVVLASGGYPGSHETGFAIEGLDDAAAVPDAFVFHAGTARRGDDIITTGGRVLAVTALGDTFADARRNAYEAAGKIKFENKHQRTDIALRAQESEGR
jgi:phosphoribosylamine--glycine ligase